MTRLFTGDYSTGNPLQWSEILGKLYDGDPAGYPGGYPFQIVNLGDCGYAARFEVRDGDAGEGETERCDVGNDNSTAPAGSTRWYAFSIKFDSTFPTNHASLGWAVTSEFKSTVGSGSPTIYFGFDYATPANYFTLGWKPQTAPLEVIGIYRLLDLPLDRGNWHDIKMRVVWSASDETGSVQVWYDGVRQTFLEDGGGGQTFTGRTMVPGDAYVQYREGYYREAISATGIVYHGGFRIADSEDGL